MFKLKLVSPLLLLILFSCGVQLTEDAMNLSGQGNFDGSQFNFSGSTSDGTLIGNHENPNSLWTWSFEITSSAGTLTCETVPGSTLATPVYVNPTLCVNFPISGTNSAPVINVDPSITGVVNIDYTLSYEEPGEEAVSASGSVSGGSSGGGAVPSIPVTPWIVQAGAGMFGSSLPGGDTSGADSCEDIQVDQSGNVYCVGTTSGSLGETQGSAGFGYDAFIMKLDPNGNLLWIKQTGSGAFGSSLPGGDTSEDDACYHLQVDSSGNVYCAGGTQGSLGEANGGGGGNDAFIMKLDPNGNLIWIKQAGSGVFGSSLPGGDSSGKEYCEQFLLDYNENIYCAGSTEGSLGEINGGLGTDLFIMKLDSNGNLLWIKQTGSGAFGSSFPGGDTSGYDNFSSLQVDSSGNVYCAGSTTGSLGEANGGSGVSDAFVMKLDPNGNLLWIKQTGSGSFGNSLPGADTSKNDTCYHLQLDSSGNAYCAGSTSGSLGEISGGSIDIFVMKIDPNGNLAWIKQAGSGSFGNSLPGGDTSLAESCEIFQLDSSGNSYCGGIAYGSLGEMGGGGSDIFLIKFNPSGDLVWIKQAGSGAFGNSLPGGDTSGLDFINQCKFDSNSNIYCVGGTYGSLGESYGGGGATSDAYVMKLNSNGSLVWIRQTGSGAFGNSLPGGITSGYDICNHLQIDSSGSVYCAGFTNGSLGEVHGGDSDLFILKLDPNGDYY